MDIHGYSWIKREWELKILAEEKKIQEISSNILIHPFIMIHLFSENKRITLQLEPESYLAKPKISG